MASAKNNPKVNILNSLEEAFITENGSLCNNHITNRTKKDLLSVCTIVVNIIINSGALALNCQVLKCYAFKEGKEEL